MHKPSSSILTETATQQWLDWCHTIHLLVSVLREQSTVRGLKDALDEVAKMWNNAMRSQDMGVVMAGVKEYLLVLGKLRESTSGSPTAAPFCSATQETAPQLGTVLSASGGE